MSTDLVTFLFGTPFMIIYYINFCKNVSYYKSVIEGFISASIFRFTKGENQQGMQINKLALVLRIYFILGFILILAF
jgi:hypothetical protein